MVEERLSEPFCAELRLVAASGAGTADLLGVAAKITIIRDDVAHVFVGEVTRAETFATANESTHARVRVEPLLCRARRATKYRIFQEITIIDIVRELLGKVGDCDFEVALDVERPRRDYCVQYGESDLQFAMRLLEDDGIAWFLDFAGDRPVMHLVEAQRGFPQIPLDEAELLLVPDQPDTADVESIQAITIARRTPSPGVSARTWNWMTHAFIDEQNHPAEAAQPWSELIEPRRMWGEYDLMTEGEIGDATRASARIEHERALCRDVMISGTSNVSALGVGLHFTFDVGLDEPQPLLVLAVRHRGDCPEVEVHGQHRSGPNYTNTFECQSLNVPHRPQLRMPKPRIHGMHTAVVTGPEGEEIHVDYKARIMVRMHWDRSGSAPELASCWLRVAQMWGGDGWGSLFIPRVGMEVLVTFLDGDPDRPLCVGCVYNGLHSIPQALPENRTKSTIRTQSSPGGNGHNELTFEDAAGSEEVYLRAQRNLRTQVLSNETRSVGGDQTIGIGGGQSVEIDGDQTIRVKGSQMVFIHDKEKSDLASSHVDVAGLANLHCREFCVTADESIVLQVGGSSIRIDENMINFLSGGGTAQTLDETSVTISKRGSVVRIADSVLLNAAGGGMMQMDADQTLLLAPPGASLVLTDSAKVGSSLGAKLELGTDASLGGASVVATAGSGGKLTLDAGAALEGVQVDCTSAGGSMALSATGATIDGTTVDVTASAMASVVAAMVKIN